MRRELLKQWPAISAVYRIHPWNTPDLTVDEINEYLQQLPRFVGGSDA